jgi:hypothetical protein
MEGVDSRPASAPCGRHCLPRGRAPMLVPTRPGRRLRSTDRLHAYISLHRRARPRSGRRRPESTRHDPWPGIGIVDRPPGNLGSSRRTGRGLEYGRSLRTARGLTLTLAAGPSAPREGRTAGSRAEVQPSDLWRASHRRSSGPLGVGRNTLPDPQALADAVMGVRELAGSAPAQSVQDRVDRVGRRLGPEVRIGGHL